MADEKIDLNGPSISIPNENNVSVIKSGETCIITTLYRSHKGLTLRVKTHPRVEEYFKSLSKKTDPIALGLLAQGRNWIPEDGKDLYIYDDGGAFKAKPFNDEGVNYRLDIPGHDLNNSYLNMSFLRLVGTSDGDGVGFSIPGVHRFDSVKNLRDMIGKVQRAIYINYLRPTKMSVVISTQDLNF